jgi:hypothetical protein
MRNLIGRGQALKALLHEGSARGKFHRGANFAAQGIVPVSGWTTRNLDENFAPASEHLRLTDRKTIDAVPGRLFKSGNAQMDGQRMKENQDAL